MCRDNWITVAHIPGVDNTAADQESRRTATSAEWMLNKSDVCYGLDTLNISPTIDLFASRINRQMEKFVSYRPDPEAVAIDAFSINWSNLTFYAFPPFNCVGRVLQKIANEKATGILVVPDWPNQIWFNTLLDMTINEVTFLPRKNLLQLPQSPMKQHPLASQLRMKKVLVSPTTFFKTTTSQTLSKR